MRILHIVTSLDPIGGAERMLQRLAVMQASDAAMEPIIISLRKGGRLADELRGDGVRVEVLGLNGASNLVQTLWRLVRMTGRLQPDVVQTWLYHADLLGGLAARLAGCRTIVWNVRNTDVFPGSGVSRSLGAIVYLCARLSRIVPSAIVCVAEAARTSHARFGYASAKMVVIPNGFSNDLEVPPGEREAVRREFAIPEAVTVIGSVGRYNLYKDQRTFVRAMGLVAARLPNARFLMVGKDVAPRNRELSGWIEETGCRDRFILTDERRDVARCFAAMDIFCLHSKSEGFPNVLAEAMLAGVPSVTTDVGDARLLGDSLVSVVPPENPEALAEAVVQLCALSGADRRQIADLARERVHARFSLEAVAQQYRSLYLNLIARRTPCNGLD